MNPTVSKIIYVIELILAELIFLYPADKRKMFFLRLAGAIIVSTGACFIFPDTFYNNVLTQLVLFVSLFAVTVVCMWFCFSVSFYAVLASCVAGYAVQHIAYHICSLLGNAGVMADFVYGPFDARNIREIVFFPFIYLVFLFTLGEFSKNNECFKKCDRRFNYISFAIVFICIGLTRFANFFGGAGTVAVSLYAITSCLMALIVQVILFRVVSLQNENETLSLLWKEERKQYEISKKTIDTINIKYHDLKRRLRDMNLPEDEVEAIKDAVRVYGSRIKTGNEALDVLLTENALYLSEEGITLSYTGNGGDLSFMSVADVYSLFGNAIDNAVEAVRKVSDREKWIIDIVEEHIGDMVSVNISNFFSGDISLSDGIPVTTKSEDEGFHGFGMKSMALIAEKYGGRIKATVEGDLFNLNIYLMRG